MTRGTSGRIKEMLKIDDEKRYERGEKLYMKAPTHSTYFWKDVLSSHPVGRP